MKAMHYGHCQVCGARQKLPGGRLAKHGYTTRWGFFSGVCRGSGERPFETHTDVIDAAIFGAGYAAQTMRAEAKELRDRPPTGKAWRLVRGGGRIAAGWTEGALSATEDGRVVTWESGGSVTRLVTLGIYERDVVAVERAMNETRARYLENEALKRDEYAAWQQERIAHWASTALVAVAA